MRPTPLFALLTLTFAGCTTPPLAPTPPVAAAPVPAAPSPSRFALPTTDDGLPGTGPIRRYPWFQKLWTERRTTWAGQIAQDQRAVVFLGDSITQG